MRINLPDVNVWLALTISTHQHHDVASEWLDGIETAEAVRFCRTTQQSLLRLLTNTSVLGAYGLQARTNEQAWEVFDALVADGRITVDHVEPVAVERRWRRYSSRGSASPKLWTDAYLAAVAAVAGHRLVTTDSGFRQFEGVDVHLLAA